MSPGRPEVPQEGALPTLVVLPAPGKHLALCLFIKHQLCGPAHVEGAHLQLQEPWWLQLSPVLTP